MINTKFSTETVNTRIMAETIRVSNDTRVSGLNNNDLIIGPSGAGKTGGYILPNLLECENSFVVADTKSNLHRTLGPALRDRGFRVHVVDFNNPAQSDGYNPLDYITVNPRTKRYSEKDIMGIVQVLCPTRDPRDEFWCSTARQVLACLIDFVLGAFPPAERNLCSVIKVYKMFTLQYAEQPYNAGCIPFLEEWLLGHPETLAAKKYQNFKPAMIAEKAWSSVMQFVCNALDPFSMDESEEMLVCKDGFRIETLGEEKSALFLNISDTDRAQDTLANLFYTQALSVLCKEADKNPDSRLKIPVRIYLDDFAANAQIPDFDKIISIIRSREISVSIILQSLSQLDGMYGRSKAMTIVNNCDHILFLGGTDEETVRYLAYRLNVSADTIMTLPLDQVYLLERGSKGIRTNKVKPYSTPIPAVSVPDEPDEFDDFFDDVNLDEYF